MASLHAGVPATRNERRSEASREENREREVLSLPLPILLAARFASQLVSRRWNTCMQANIWPLKYSKTRRIVIGYS